MSFNECRVALRDMITARSESKQFRNVGLMASTCHCQHSES